ncbi:hypothetical protein [Ferrovibrio terrae]|uniref:PepSY domain-containing protein n=1 Tax=Ferrovibrio terrae TaxID=2594003 RepID=UPI0031380F00
MNNLAALILLGAISGMTAPAQAMEPVRGPAPSVGAGTSTGPSAGIVQVQGAPSSQAPAAPDSPAAQIEPPDGPPAGALSLSQIITQIESRPDFAFIRDIDWDDGRYIVQYRTRDGRDRDLKIDPRTGRPVEGALPMVQWPKT